MSPELRIPHPKHDFELSAELMQGKFCYQCRNCH